MNEHIERAAKYRRRAERVRAELSGTNDKLSREALETIASGYDQLARIQEKFANANKTGNNVLKFKL